MVRDLLRSHHLLLRLLLRRKVRRLRHRLLNHRRQNNQRRHRRRRRAMVVVVGEGWARCGRCLGGYFQCGNLGMFDRDSQDLGEMIVMRMSASLFLRLLACSADPAQGCTIHRSILSYESKRQEYFL